METEIGPLKERHGNPEHTGHRQQPRRPAAMGDNGGMKFIDIQGKRIEVARWLPAHPRAGAPACVLLHEGLGSVAMWREFPDRLAEATGGTVFAYSRLGYGRSDRPDRPRNVRYLHDEALLVLPDVLAALGVDTPLLIGHSDGASIALLHAGGATRPVAGVIVMAPHVFVEDVTVAGVARTRRAYETTDLRTRLARYHDDPDGAFHGWNDIWLDPAFRDWNIEDCLPRIACPVVAIQGANDEYGTMEQLHRIACAVHDVQVLELPACGHAPHVDQPRAVLDAAAALAARVTAAAGHALVSSRRAV